MIWVTWRQFRVSAAATAAALAALALVLGLTGPGIADEYSEAVAACTAQGSDCSELLQRFVADHGTARAAVTAAVVVLPALAGLFWGAPLVARELEAGTHRLVWNQSVTRVRWLAVKVGLTAAAAMTAAGLLSLVVTWWSGPLDRSAFVSSDARLEPLLFAARGLVPVAYAAFAVALGVTVGMLVRRAIPAMAITLAVFVAVQIAVPTLVRPHLRAPVVETVAVTESNNTNFLVGAEGEINVAATVDHPGAWILSLETVDGSGRAVDSVILPPDSPCASELRSEGGPDERPVCLLEIERLGYRQQVTYQPADRFWPFQWYETGIFIGAALGLAAFCLWRIRRLVA